MPPQPAGGRCRRGWVCGPFYPACAASLASSVIRFPPQYLYVCVHMNIIVSVHRHRISIGRCEKENGMERRRPGAQRPLAWKRSLQLPAAVAEAGMALRLRQGDGLRRRSRIRVPGSPIQPTGMPEVPVASSLVVGPPRRIQVRSPLLCGLSQLRLSTRALPEIRTSTISRLLIGREDPICHRLEGGGTQGRGIRTAIRR